MLKCKAFYIKNKRHWGPCVIVRGCKFVFFPSCYMVGSFKGSSLDLDSVQHRLGTEVSMIAMCCGHMI